MSLPISVTGVGPGEPPSQAAPKPYFHRYHTCVGPHTRTSLLDRQMIASTFDSRPRRGLMLVMSIAIGCGKTSTPARFMAGEPAIAMSIS